MKECEESKVWPSSKSMTSSVLDWDEPVLLGMSQGLLYAVMELAKRTFSTEVGMPYCMARSANNLAILFEKKLKA